jgi:hypothetical protein
LKVFVLTADISDGADYDGIRSVHATQAGALARFDELLRSNGIDLGAVHYADVKLSTFLGGDPDPDTLDGVEIHWGINESEVLE